MDDRLHPGAGLGILHDAHHFGVDRRGVAWDAQGNIFVSDGYDNSRVAKFSKDGDFVKSIGSRGTAPDQFNTPHAITYDNKGLIYVADRGNNRMFHLDLDATIAVTGVVVLVMALVGGSWAVLASDFIQVLILMPVCLAVTVLAVLRLGGPAEFLAQLPARHLDPGQVFSTDFLGLWCVAMLLKQLHTTNNLADANRYLCAKDGTHARRAGYEGEVLDKKALVRQLQENQRRGGFVVDVSRPVSFGSRADKRRAAIDELDMAFAGAQQPETRLLH